MMDVDFLKSGGEESLKSNKYEEALESFCRAIEENPRLIPDVLLVFEKAIEEREVNLKLRLTLVNFELLSGEIEEAIIDLEEILDIDPKATQVYNILGKIYLKQQNVEDAIKVLERALREDIKDISLTTLLAGAYLDRNELEAAVSLYEEVYSLNPADKETLRILGDLYSKVKNFDKAAEMYKTLFEVDRETEQEVIHRLEELAHSAPQNIRLREILAEIYIKILKPSLAVEQYNEIVSINPKELDGAVKHYRRIREIYPNEASALLSLSSALVRKGAYSEAVEVYRNLEKLGGDFLSKAIEGYKSIIKVYPNQVLAHSALGDAYFEASLYDEAVEEYKTTLSLTEEGAEEIGRRCLRILKLKGESILAYEVLGLSYLKTKEARKAASIAQEMINLSRDSPSSYILLGDALFNLGLPDKASQAYRDALKLDPYNISLHKKYREAKRSETEAEISKLKKRIDADPWKISLHLDLAKLYILLGERDLSIKELQIALRDQSREAITLNLLGLIFFEQGKFDLAMEDFRAAKEKVPPELPELSKTITLNLGTVYEVLGMYKDAVKLYEEVMQKDIEFGNLKGKVKLLLKTNPIFLRCKTLSCLTLDFGGREIIGMWGRDPRKSEVLKEALSSSFGSEHNNLGFDNFMKGAFSKAREEFLLATQLDPANSFALNNLGVLLMKEGNIDEAEYKILSAIEADPDCAIYYNNLGLVKYLKGDLRAAEASLRKAIHLDPDLPFATLNLGDILYTLGNAKQAVECWKKLQIFNILSQFAEQRLSYLPTSKQGLAGG